MGIFSKILNKKKKESVEAPIESPKTHVPEEIKIDSSAHVNQRAGIGIIHFPHVTEKSVSGNKFGVYAFRVRAGATKPNVKSAVEARYSVKVRDVRITKAHSKVRRMGRRMGVKPGYVKALVVLEKGQAIELGS